MANLKIPNQQAVESMWSRSWLQAGLCGLLVGVPAVQANPRADIDALLQALAGRRDSLAALELQALPAGTAGRALSKTLRRPDGLTLGIFAANVADADRASVRQAFAAYADRTLAPLVLALPRVAPASPNAPGVLELRLPLGGGAQLLLSWASDQPFDTRSQATLRDTCDQALPPWEAGRPPDTAMALAGSHRRQVWTTPERPPGARFQRLSEWELRALRDGGHAWIATQDRCLPLSPGKP